MNGRIVSLLSLLFSLLWLNLAHAAVIMTGTRVIMPAEKGEVSLQFKNNGDTPFLVQIWADQNNPGSTPETADAPFVVNPQIFRINGNGGQTARLVYAGDGQLPQDRESIFYLNFNQIAAMSKDMVDQNKLVITVKNRVKVFYRPKKIVGKVTEMPAKWTFSVQQEAQGTALKINNPTNYHANFTTATLKTGQQSIKVIKDQVAMLAPQSSAIWTLADKVTVSKDAVLSITYIDDYGAIVTQNIPLQQP